MLGSLALGALMGAVAVSGWPRPGWREFWTVGLLGSFTTYSALAAETVRLAEDSAALGLLYLGAHLVLGLTAALAGLTGGQALVVRYRRAGAPKRFQSNDPEREAAP